LYPDTTNPEKQGTTKNTKHTKDTKDTKDTKRTKHTKRIDVQMPLGCSA